MNLGLVRSCRLPAERVDALDHRASEAEEFVRGEESWS